MGSLRIRRTLLATGILYALAGAAFGAESTQLTGHILRTGDHHPIAGLKLRIKESGARAETKSDGRFAFENVTPGTYTLIIEVSESLIERSVTLAANGVANGEIELDANALSSALDRVVVIGQRSTVIAARAAQQDAPNLINLTTAEEISKLPDVNAAEAVRRIPGISLETDTGEGRYVNIRGIDSDLNSTTFGGLRLPPSNNASPQGGGRAVAMDAIPTGLIGALVVTKTNTPEQDAEALGGTIEITPKTAPPGAGTFLSGHLGSGWEELRNTAIADVSLTAGTRFGGGDLLPTDWIGYGDKPFSLVGTVSYYEDKRGIDDLEAGYVDAQSSGVPDRAYSALDQREYQYNRKRRGYGLDLGFTPDANNTWYIRGFDAGYTENKEDDHLTWNFAGMPTVNPNAPTVFTDGVNNLAQTIAYEKERIDNKVFVAGGKNIFANDLVLDYRLGHTEGSYTQFYSYGADFLLTPPAGALATYDNSSNPDFPSIHAVNLNPYAQSQYLLDPGGLSNAAQSINDQENSFAMNLRIPLRFTDDEDENVKLGFSGRLRDRQQFQQQWSFNVPSSLSNYPLSANTVNAPYTYYNGLYTNAGKINLPALVSLVGPHAQFVAATDNIADEQAYNAEKEDVYGAYGQYQFGWGPLTFLAGARVENTRATYSALSGPLVYDDGGNLIGFDAHTNVQDSTYTNLFPTLQARYEFDHTLIGRAAISSAIARPGFEQITSAIVVDPVAVAVTEGNPQLKPTTGVNYDFSLEKYLSNGGIASIGVFDKEFSHYIGGTTINRTFTGSGEFPTLQGVGTINSFINLPHSYARGIELNYEQRFRELPGWLSGFGLGGNLTLVDSSFQIRPGQQSLLPSTSRTTANAYLFYERSGLDLRLGAYYVARDLFAIGSSRDTDVWSAAVTQLDFGASYKVAKNYGVYFNAKNLTNYVLKFTEGTADRPIQREFYGRTFLAGLNFEFE